MSAEDDEAKIAERRKLLTGGIGFALNAYLHSHSLLNPVGLATSVLDQYEEQQQNRQEAEMRAMVSQIENLRAIFENGKLIIHMDNTSILGLVERTLKQSLAASEAGMTAKFKIDSGPDGGKDHEAELVLPSRCIYLKFVPKGIPVEAFANWYLERARNVNPSEYWLLTPEEEKIDIQFEPIFSENRITRGRLKTYPLTSLLSELVGKDYDLEAAYDADGFKFVISEKQSAIPNNEED